MATAPGEIVSRRHDDWCDLLRDQFVNLDIAVEEDSPAFGGTVHSSHLGHLQVSTVRSVNQDISRTPRLLRHDRRHYFQVGLVQRGEAFVAQDGHEAVLRPGDFVIYETERPFRWSLRSGRRSPEWDLAVFTWPRHTIDLHARDTASLTGRPLRGDQGMTGVLSRMLADLLRTRPSVGESGAIRLADEIGRLVTTVAGDACGADAEDGRHADLLRRIDTYLDEHLPDPDLSTDTVAQAHFMSARQLQRLFAHRGHRVSDVIRRRRLERCRRDLANPRESGATLAEICFRWGFTHPAVFSRAFREAYGMSPSTYRAKSRS
ncbi:helix-turn-helix domain-containing protein [Amycolatopsis thermoflava]|uniref:helix-turn-helix domain-containing protein n=1 Tax=Amycolatopsis thermoflava TaxID=84480 RepID=UPI0003FE8BBE|nr:helix-turn-helix domain-containing protein [Amycolatopsis thermoflava]